MIRLIKACLPDSICSLYWTLKNAWAYCFSDYTSRFETLDYETYWKARDTSNEDLCGEQKQRTEIVCRLISNNDFSLLDVGGGDGLTLYHIKKRHPHIEGLCVDLSRYAVNVARNRGINAIAGNILEMDLEKYDVVLLLKVLEHIPNSEEYLILPINLILTT